MTRSDDGIRTFETLTRIRSEVAAVASTASCHRFACSVTWEPVRSWSIPRRVPFRGATACCPWVQAQACSGPFQPGIFENRSNITGQLGGDAEADASAAHFREADHRGSGRRGRACPVRDGGPVPGPAQVPIEVECVVGRDPDARRK